MRVKFLLLFIVISFFIKPGKSIAQVNVQDSLALVDYYDSTYGVSPWQFGQSWDLNSPVSTWSGIGVSNNRVVSILLRGGGGAGRIPSSFGNLTALQSIDFLDYRLSAILPESFGNLISLNRVRFHAVFYNTPFPAALTKAPNLNSIDMEDNYFTDGIPASIGNMKNLVTLNLFQNRLSGPIPESINNLDALTSMDISYNHYTFKDIVPFINNYNTSQKTYALSYSPQANLTVHRYNNKLAVSAGGTLSNDTFKWYKDSVLVATTIGDSTYAPEDTGRYYVAVNNSIATDLTLYANEFTLHYILPGSSASATKNITGTSPININDNIFEIAKLQPATGANQLTGNVTALVIVDSSVSTFHSQPYVQRHYDITLAVNANNAQATITLYFTQQDFDNYNNYVTANNLNLPLLPTGGIDNGNVQITQFHGNFTGSSRPENYDNPNVVLITPNVVWDNTDQWWTVTFPVTGFSGFFVSTSNTALPLTLLNFSGKLHNNSIDLQWLTSNQISTKEFIVEHSANGNPFNNIGSIKASSTAGNNSYNFNDANPVHGINFYRLKMVDKDSKFSYSNVIKINCEGPVSVLEVFPNPATLVLNIKIASGKNESIILRVADALGKTIIKTSVSVNAGITQFPLNIGKLSSGLYYLYAMVNGNVQKITFIKK